MTPNRRQVLLATGGALVCSAFPVAATNGVQFISGPAFGASWRAALPASANAVGAKAVIEEAITAVDLAMSPYLRNSEVSRFNGLEGTDWVPMSDATCRVVSESLSVASLTNGAFDPCVGPMVNKYGFGPIESSKSAHSDGNYKNISVGSTAVRKSVPGLTLDLCGIAKGYALDRMADGLRAESLSDFLIEVGGEVFATGTHPSGRKWQVGIEQPNSDTVGFQRIIGVDGVAVATSGHQHNGYATSDQVLSHIIDPHTARPVTNDILSVSVVAPTALLADALATALIVMGPEAGIALAGKEQISALFLMRDGGDLREVMTTNFVDYVLG